MPALTAPELLAAFRELSQELAARGMRAHIYMVGGAAIALGFDAERHTRDVDALVLNRAGEMEEAVQAVGRRRGWRNEWLNDDAAAFIPAGADGRALTAYEGEGLLVTAASAEWLLAMKLRALRPKDWPDIAVLTEHLNLSCARDAWNIYDEAFPHDPPSRENFMRACEVLRLAWPGDRSMDGDDRYGYIRGGDDPGEIAE